MKQGTALWLSAVLALSSGCAGAPRLAEPADVNPQATSPARIEAIVPTLAADRTQVVVQANAPLLYTSYQPDPSRLVIEIQGADVSSLPPRIEIGQGMVEAVLVSSDPRAKTPRAQLEFTGVAAASPQVRSEGTNLVVEFSASPTVAGLIERSLAPDPVAPSVATQALRDTPAVQGQTVPPAPPQAVPRAPRAVEAVPQDPTRPATLLLGIDPTSVDGGARITLRADGQLSYRTFTLERPDRLVFDLLGVQNSLGSRHVQVDAGAIDVVRVAQFRPEPDAVARVVFDLNAPAPYRVVEKRDRIEVVVGETAVAALPAQEPPQTDAPTLTSAPATAVPTTEPSTPIVVAAAPAPGPDTLAVPKSAETPIGEPPLRLDQMGAPADDDYVLFDQASASPSDTLRSTVPAQFEALTIVGDQKSYTGEKISVNFVEADLKNVFLFFADFIGLNIVIDPEVQGNLTMRLNQVPWDQAFDVILRHQGLEKIVDGNVVRIATTEKLRQEASQRQALKKAQEAEVDPVTFTKVLSYAKVDQVVPILLTGVKTERGRVVQDARTNTLIITDVPSKREAYQKLIDVLDTRTQQVMIEARIVETDRNYENDLGILWNVFASADPALGTQTSLDFPHRATVTYDVNVPAAASASNLGISLGNVLDSFTLDIALQAFENEGKVRILSSPKIATQNNQTATIEQGTQIPVVTTTAVEINVQFISASLKLEVTPQITAEDTVIMNVTVENNSPDFVNRVGDVPPIITEKARTQILVRDGSTAVIGGIFKLTESNATAGVPGLKDIPALGWLFKNRSITKSNQELLVFLTPRILKNDA
jgi:type IV pilus assembly protein PilQ